MAFNFIKLVALAVVSLLFADHPEMLPLFRFWLGTK
jgi:hypothetical protein